MKALPALAIGDFRERPAAAALGHSFASVWVHRLPEAAAPIVVTPDGTIDLQWMDGSFRVAGPDRDPKLELLPAGTTVIGFRFHPGAAAAWLRMPAAEIVGQRLALDRQLQSLKTSERVAEAGLKVGNIARVDLLRVQAAVAAVQAQIAGADGQERKVRAQLAALMGAPGFDAAVPAPDSGPTHFPANRNLLPPSIQTAQSALQASQDKVRAAQRAMLPQFAATGGWNRNAVHWDNRPVDTWQFNLGVTFNL